MEEYTRRDDSYERRFSRDDEDDQRRGGRRRYRDDDDDFDDDRPRRRRRYRDDDGPEHDLTDRMLMPYDVSPWAFVAGYLGLVSVLFIPAPFALAAGIMGVRQIRRDRRKTGMGRAVFGIIMGGLFTLGLIFILIAYLATGFK